VLGQHRRRRTGRRRAAETGRVESRVDERDERADAVEIRTEDGDAGKLRHVSGL
jgi:hypothetical protein